MADKPITMKPFEMKALLAGTKTQTRRTFPARLRSTYLANEIGSRRYWNVSGAVGGVIKLEPDFLRLLPYRVGDRLYVREAFLPDPSANADEWDDWTCSYTEWSGTGCKANQVPPALRSERNVIFQADPKWADVALRFTNGRYMPRWASRITLTVTDVRVQRLREISEEDAVAEGIEKVPYDGDEDEFQGCFGWKDYSDHPHAIAPFRSPVRSYQTLWDSINGPGAWDANPWVAAYSLAVHLTNIDRLEAATERTA